MSTAAASLIIPTYRREAPLRETLACVAQIATPGVEVLVVDQTLAHEPETDALLAELARVGRIRYVTITRANLPYARNVGLKLTRAPIVIFIDDDVAFGSSFVEAHLAAFAAPDVWASAGRVHLRARVAGEPLPPSCPTADSAEWFDQRVPLERVATARGCNMAFRRAALERIGGFDASYVGSSVGEEEDACFGLRALGGRIVFTPDAWLIHRVDPGGTRAGSHDPRAQPAYFRNRFYFVLKNTVALDAAKVLVRAYREAIANRQVLALGPAEIVRRHTALVRGALWALRDWRATGCVRRRLSYRSSGGLGA